MGDQFEFVTVERLPVGKLQLKRRVGGHTALEILHLAESTRILTNIFALLEVLEDEPDSDNDGSDNDDDSDDEAARKRRSNCLNWWEYYMHGESLISIIRRLFHSDR